MATGRTRPQMDEWSSVSSALICRWKQASNNRKGARVIGQPSRLIPSMELKLSSEGLKVSEHGRGKRWPDCL
jgi:hypothetical protein